MHRTLSSGVVPVRRYGDGWRVLLLRAYRNWDFPKGKLEPGETPLEAARRETREETGVEDLVFSWGEEYRETEPYGRGKVARYYIALTRAERVVLGNSPVLGRPEHHEYRWVDLRDARRLLPPRLLDVLAWAEEKLGAPEPRD